jgi:hypothetical protein
MKETFFIRTQSGQWFQFTTNREYLKKGDQVIKMFEKLGNPVEGWTIGVESFERIYKLFARNIPSLTA